ncbi:MAG: helix-turn-helix transcriptional regulator [Brachymonas sp.]|nr:helix-turn-helix transcriptional regulator [Brachymonas sp.]
MLERMEKMRGSHPARAVFARNVRRIRRLREVSQESLAADAGLSRTYIGEVEREERAVSIDIMGQIADALGVPLRDLLDPGLSINIEMAQK